MNDDEKSEQLKLFQEIRFRLTLPFKPFSWSFFSYLIFFVVGYGGLGIWFTIYNYSATDQHFIHVPPAIGTYFLALWATSFFDLNTSKDVINKKSIFNISMGGLGLAILFLFFSQGDDIFAYFWASVGLLFAIIYWVFVNADNESFYESFEEQVKGESKDKHGERW